MIIEKRGNIVDDDAELLVCTTNCVGVMGKGVALAFKKKWPHILHEYKRDCKHDLFSPGSVWIYDINMFQKWAAFCTKMHWKNSSQYNWIDQGLYTLHQLIISNKFKTIAIPSLGCGNGGLKWDVVYESIKFWFQYTDYEVRVYLP